MRDAWVILAWVGGKPVERGRTATWAEADSYRKALEGDEGCTTSIDDLSQWERERLRLLAH